jgi:hypothetical protein
LTCSVALLSLLLLAVACGPTVNQVKPQQTVTIGQSFQRQTTPLPTVPPYRCGAWTSNNAPNAFSTINVFARLTKDVMGVGGATAVAVAHFQNGDMTLDQQPKSDNSGMVSFTLSLQGRQPQGVPTTIDVSFTTEGTTVQCSQAFFTPQ